MITNINNINFIHTVTEPSKNQSKEIQSTINIFQNTPSPKHQQFKLMSDEEMKKHRLIGKTLENAYNNSHDPNTKITLLQNQKEELESCYALKKKILDATQSDLKAKDAFIQTLETNEKKLTGEKRKLEHIMAETENKCSRLEQALTIQKEISDIHCRAFERQADELQLKNKKIGEHKGLINTQIAQIDIYSREINKKDKKIQEQADLIDTLKSQLSYLENTLLEVASRQVKQENEKNDIRKKLTFHEKFFEKLSTHYKNQAAIIAQFQQDYKNT